LIGANFDEATALGRGRGPDGRGVDTDEEMRAAIAGIISPQAETNTGKLVGELVDELMYLYPDIQSIGVPSLETWPVVIRSNDS
jgi:acetylcholinesterase